MGTDPNSDKTMIIPCGEAEVSKDGSSDVFWVLLFLQCTWTKCWSALPPFGPSQACAKEGSLDHEIPALPSLVSVGTWLSCVRKHPMEPTWNDCCTCVVHSNPAESWLATGHHVLHSNALEVPGQ